jgi:hypothetical protein
LGGTLLTMKQGQPAATYRLYFLDAQNHIEDVEVLHCASDEEASVSAGRHVNGRSLELWDRGRFILRLPKKQSC